MEKKKERRKIVMIKEGRKQGREIFFCLLVRLFM